MHTVPYTVSFYRYECPNDKVESVTRELETRGIWVTFGRTRRGRWVFRSKMDGEDMAMKQVDADFPERDDMVSHYECDRAYIRACLRYSVLSELCGSELMDDTDVSETCWAFFTSLPKPKYPTSIIELAEMPDYFQLAEEGLKAAKLKFIENGFREWS